MSNIPPDNNPFLNRPRVTSPQPLPPAPDEPSQIPSDLMTPLADSAAAAGVPPPDPLMDAGPSGGPAVMPAAERTGSGADATVMAAPALASPRRDPPPTPRSAQSDAGLAGVRDTIESIIIALILAFTFRAFVLEAFVIPTGSMAPTLSGAHWIAVCPKCGQEFNVNAGLQYQAVRTRGRVDGPNGRTSATFLRLRRLRKGELTNGNRIPALLYGSTRIKSLVCPNCGYHIPLADLPGKPLLRPVAVHRRGPMVPMYFPWTRNGDRILVLKYLYYFMRPRRWDVIVFKEPIHAKQNYIKRLVGLPGETVEIVGGNVFINGKIAHKPPEIEKATLQLVYNNDHYPIDAGQMRSNGDVWRNPWTAAAGPKLGGRWNIASPVFTYAAGKRKTGEIRFHQIRMQTDDPRKMYLWDTIGYDDGQRYNRVHIDADLYLRSVWLPRSAKASLFEVIGQKHNRFAARIANDGTISLLRFDAKKKAYVSLPIRRGDTAARISPIKAGRVYRLAFSNLEHEVRFWVNGHILLDHKTPWTVADAEAYVRSGRSDEVPEIAIRATGSCTLSHLLLKRDIYYTQMGIQGLSDRRGTGTEHNPITLGPRQYFVLGDNSVLSADGRAWPEVAPALADLHLHRGVVPQRFLLGKAIFVFWPPGFRLSREFAYPLVPNAGRMRFIR